MNSKTFYNCLNNFYYNNVILSEEKLKLLKEKKNLNIRRLKEGLEDYNKEHNTSYHIDEFIVQGSVAMGTTVSSDENDYDIDIAVIMKKSSLPEGTLSAKRIISDSLKKKCLGMKNEPDATGNSITIEYEDGYHLDFALYGKVGDEYYHCGSSEWDKRNPRSVSKWFNDQNQNSQGKLKKIVKYIKFFCKQDSSWVMPGGLIISVLVDEVFKSEDISSNIDELLKNIINRIISRLKINKEIYNPTDKSISLLNKQRDYDKINNLLTRLEIRITKINQLHETSSIEEYYDAWNYFFGGDYFNDTNNQKLIGYEDPEEEVDSFFVVKSRGNNDKLITCQLSSKEGKTDGYTIRNYESGTQLSVSRFRDKELIFKANPSNYGPYVIMWKIKNNGSKAKENNSLRGEIKYSNYNTLNDAPFIEGKERHEGISFAGNHYVECYVIKDNIVVEEGKFMVNFID